jgi:periplasmic copper chaperone A
MQRPILPILLAGLLTACGSGHKPPLVAEAAALTAPRPGVTTRAVYLELRNPGKVPVKIDRVTSAQFGRVEFHRTTSENGVARMRPVPALEIGAGETVRLEPGGMHLMLMDPQEGFADEVTLHFWSGETLLLTVDIAAGGST